VVDYCELIDDEDGQVADHFRGHKELLASIFIIFNGNSLSHGGLRSNQMSSVLDAFKKVILQLQNMPAERFELLFITREFF